MIDSQYSIGERVKCKFRDSAFYDATITNITPSESGGWVYDVFWMDGDHQAQKNHPEGDIRKSDNKESETTINVKRGMSLIRKAESKGVPKEKVKNFLLKKGLEAGEIMKAYTLYHRTEHLVVVQDPNLVFAIITNLDPGDDDLNAILRFPDKWMKDVGLDNGSRLVRFNDKWLEGLKFNDIKEYVWTSIPQTAQNEAPAGIVMTFRKGTAVFERDHLSPVIARSLIDYLIPYVCDELCWITGQELITLIVGFLIHLHKSTADKQPCSQFIPAYNKYVFTASVQVEEEVREAREITL